MTLSILLGAAVLQLVALSLAMTVAWGVQQRTGNSGWIDAVWTCAVGVVGVASALWPLGEETSARQILVAASPDAALHWRDGYGAERDGAVALRAALRQRVARRRGERAEASDRDRLGHPPRPRLSAVGVPGYG